jgi:hypothetical protein
LRWCAKFEIGMSLIVSVIWTRFGS